jgi:hypothetical protein
MSDAAEPLEPAPAPRAREPVEASAAVESTQVGAGLALLSPTSLIGHLARSPAERRKAVIDDLNGHVGNRRVARLIGGSRVRVRSLQRDKKTSPPRTGGWNEAVREVAGTIRVPVKGVTTGNQQDDPNWATEESAKGRAVVVVPDKADLTQGVDVFLFFHGMGNVGFRERSQPGDEGAVGTVHDVEDDRIPQQLAASGRNIVGVLPQGTDGSGFGIADPAAYVNEVLNLALPDIKAKRPTMKVPKQITPQRIIVSGHSGGGPPATKAATALTKTKAADENAWVRSSPLFLFDGINGTTERDNVAALMRRWLDEDAEMLSKSNDPLALLGRRGIKMRSTWSSGRYKALNVGGEYDWERKALGPDNKPFKGPDDKWVKETVHEVVPANESLQGVRDRWFDTKGKKLDSAVAAKLKEQYKIEHVGGSHEYTVGTGQTAEQEGKKRLKAPTGVTGPSETAGVPDYSGGGHLHESLAQLPKDAPLSQ